MVKKLPILGSIVNIIDRGPVWPSYGSVSVDFDNS